MKNFKKILACVMAVATLGSVSMMPMDINASMANDTQIMTYFNGSYHFDEEYYKSNTAIGKTGIICLSYNVSYSDEVDDKSIVYDSFVNELTINGVHETCYRIATIDGYYYYDDTSSDGIVKVDSLDISDLDNIAIFTWDSSYSEFTNEDLSELLSKNGIDISQCENIYNSMPYFYDDNNNEYFRYFMNGEWLLTGAYLPDKISTNDDNIITYLNETYKTYTEYYLNKNDILDKPTFSTLFKDENNFTAGDDFLYYKDGYSLASFYSSINCTLFFESENPNLTVDDVLTKEQQDFLYFLDGSCINIELRNNGTSEITGLTRYSMYLPKCKDDLSYNEFMEYKYKLGQSLLDKGIAKTSFFSGVIGFDDYNSISAKSNIAIIMKDGSEPTTELFGEYANEVESIEKVSCDDGNTLAGEDYYYKVTLINADTNAFESYNHAVEIVRDLQNNENVKYVGGIDTSYISTELASFGHNMSYEIPILPSDNDNDTTIGDSDSITEITVGESTYPRGDINLDGKTTTIDLLMLKKYLLGLMEW